MVDDAVKQQCVFCQIIAGAVPSRLVYQDAHCVAVLDINPVNPGHVLLLTKEHYMILPQVPDEVTGHLGTVAKALSNAITRALKAEGTNVFVANGTAGGQRAQHFMVHIIPRRNGDGVNVTIPKPIVEEAEKEVVEKALVATIETFLGYVPSEVSSEEKQGDALTEFLTKT